MAAREPEQLDMMEAEVVAQVASDLPVASDVAHEIEPLEPGEADVPPAERLETLDERI